MGAGRWVALLLAFAGVALLAAFWADHTRNTGFEPVTVLLCEESGCSGADPSLAEHYEAALDGGLSPWNDVDFCAAAIGILGDTPKGDRLR